MTFLSMILGQILSDGPLKFCKQKEVTLRNRSIKKKISNHEKKVKIYLCCFTSIFLVNINELIFMSELQLFLNDITTSLLNPIVIQHLSLIL